jgi:thioesterase domain-containing protein
VGGNVLEFYDLARHLGTDQPFYGLQSRGLDGRHAPHARIEDMAADYVREIRSLQPSGPYFLGGRSLGGIIAYEMARQLRAQDQKSACSLLILIRSGIST